MVSPRPLVCEGLERLQALLKLHLEEAGRRPRVDKKLQYPRPGDVIWYPVRPDLNPYLDPEHPDQPQISPEQAEAFARQAYEIYKYVGDGKVPGKERIKFDDWRRRDKCSGRNLIWEYLQRGDGSVGNGLEKCVGYVRLLMDHSCAITVTVS